MINRTRSLLAAGILAALTCIAAAGTVRAQGVPWGACLTTDICNLSNCPVTLTLLTTPAGALPVINLLPGQCLLNVPTAGIISIDWVVSSAGIKYPVLPPPPPPLPPCNCLPHEWHTCCVTLPPWNCCFDVCFDNTVMPCRITIHNAACIPPGPCRP